MDELQVDDLEKAIDRYTAQGYRLEMIGPADAPSVALMSIDGVHLLLKAKLAETSSGGEIDKETWITGRAGMQYRDLIPGRLCGKVIASHIRLANGGPVADYVHYHKVDFQMIYCLKGRIRVVYEDQGPPFWLETGDCVVQPPEIRHRVLECTSGAEVLEVSMPAEHETWIDHDLQLPSSAYNPKREFNGQQFVLTRMTLNT